MFRTIINVVKEQVKKLLEPAPVAVVASALADLPRSKWILSIKMIA